LEDGQAKYRYGLECLFRFFSYGLEKKFRKDLAQDFMEFTLIDCKDGYLYGLEKFWAFLKYRKDKRPIDIPQDLQKLLSQYRTIDDFRKAKASRQPPVKRTTESDNAKRASDDPVKRTLSFNEFPPLSTSPSSAKPAQVPSAWSSPTANVLAK